MQQPLRPRLLCDPRDKFYFGLPAPITTATVSNEPAPSCDTAPCRALLVVALVTAVWPVARCRNTPYDRGMSTLMAEYRDAIGRLPAGATLIVHPVEWEEYERLLSSPAVPISV